MATIVGSGLESYIKRNAREEAMNRIARAKEEAKQILDRTQQRVRLIQEESRRNTAEKIAAQQRRLLAQAELEAQAYRLDAREKVLSEAWDLVESRLLSLGPASRRLASLRRLLIDAASQLEGGRISVQVSDQDRELLDDETQSSLAAELDEKCGVTLVRIDQQPGAISGGVIVSALDARRVVDNSWDERLAQARSELRNLLYQHLTAQSETNEDGTQ